MARPRSILGLLFHLMRMHARRWPVWALAAACLAVAVLAVLAWDMLARPRHHGDARVGHGGIQLAVLHDGFALTYPADGGRRVIEIDAQGRARRATTVRRADDQRIVGTRAGTAVAWQGDRKLRLARVAEDGDGEAWGKSVRQLCDGVASNDARFAVGWLESDDTVWMVHGPVAAGAAAAEAMDLAAPAAELARNDWCGVASAERNVALFWRSADRLRFQLCTRRSCSGLVATFRLDRRLPILGFGCLSNACLVAARDEAGHARLAFLTETGKSKWTRPLDTPARAVAITGIGDGAFAVGYAAETGAEVVRFDRKGGARLLWRDPSATSAPAVVWSSGRLLIARDRGGSLVYETIPLPR